MMAPLTMTSTVLNGRMLLLPFLFLPLFLFGGERYAAVDIPPSLLPAPAVIREHSLQFRIKDNRNATLTVLHAVTIFSKEEQDQGNLVLPYNKFRTVEELTGTIFDAAGEEVREMEDEEVRDYSAVDDYTLHDDSRVKYVSMVHNVYPYTVEYSYEIEFSGSLSWPQWYSRTDENPVQHSSITVTVPHFVHMRSWCNRDSVRPVVVKQNSSDIYTWERSMQPLLAKDDLGGDLYDAATIVMIAPDDFQLEQQHGSMRTWKDFGQWYYGLKNGRTLLPENGVRDVASIVSSTSSRRETAQKLYEYMQSKTRYVSVQLGIGGWQPFDATYVHSRGYGDCKALTNYMESLLHQAGIEAYPVLINSGNDRNPMITEFPSQQFNHVILCVPLEKDTVWMECTSQSLPFGRLSYSTQNRHALLIAPTGGAVVRTPSSTAFENRQVRTGTARLDIGGNAFVSFSTGMFGQRQVATQYSVLHATPKERHDWVLSQLELGNITLSGFSFKGLEDRSPVITLEMEATLPRYGSVNGNRLFFHPSVVARRSYVPPARPARISPVRFEYPYTNIDSISFKLPDGYMVETLPPETVLNSSFGSFHGKTTASGDTAVTYYRRTDLRDYAIPAAHYAEYRNFIADIVKADRAQVVLKKR
jgi:transglutaminase-like putative cysteine protease